MVTTTYEDILYEERDDGVAKITINRPAIYNAFRGQTVDELIHAFQRAGWTKNIGVVVLTGAGDKAFCTGGDQSVHDGQYDGRGTIGLPIDELQSLIRDVPKPVIARVNGFAIGGGNVRSHDRVGHSAVWSGRPQGRIGRSGIWHRLSLAHRRREEGARDMVYVSSLYRAGSARYGARQRGRSA